MYLLYTHTYFQYIHLFFKGFIYLFLERGEGKEKEREEHQCVVAFHAPPAGDLACNPDMGPDWESNQRPLASQAGTQSTEPHQPGLKILKMLVIFISAEFFKKE